MVGLLDDIWKIGLFGSGLSLFTLMSFIGRVNRDMSGGVLAGFVLLHAIALLIALICVAIAIKQHSSSEDASMENIGVAILIGCIPALGLLFTVWMGCGLGFWIGS